jgi:hypothetical protein
VSTTGRLAALLAEHGVTVRASSYRQAQGAGPIRPGKGLRYSITGGTPWGRRVAASMIRTATPGSYTFETRHASTIFVFAPMADDVELTVYPYGPTSYGQTGTMYAFAGPHRACERAAAELLASSPGAYRTTDLGGFVRVCIPDNKEA